MSKKQLPAAPAGRPCARVTCETLPFALDRWDGGIKAAATDDNSISVFDVIGQDYWGEGVTAKRIAGALRAMNGADVTVNINSPGGDMFEGLAIYNLLREYEGRVTVKVLGIAASAASVIAMAGDEIQIGRGAFLMIHNCWVYAMGNDDGTFTITGAWHDPDKYARIDTGAIIDQRPVSVIPPGNQSPPDNIVISSFSVVQQNISVETMRVSWDQAQNAIAYEAQWHRNDGNWVNVPRSSTTSFDVPGIYAGRYLVRVRAINAAEISSGWGYSEEKTLTGKVGNPPKPVGFIASDNMVFGIELSWGFPANTDDTLKTEIQYSLTGTEDDAAGRCALSAAQVSADGP
ncbi:ATP-dependent Clp protease proteolytic subunit [Enterobacter sp. K16B]|nr:ATP-dependent Clp protease proteolytic subunit [Enterobacter sp. K16B]